MDTKKVRHRSNKYILLICSFGMLFSGLAYGERKLPEKPPGKYFALQGTDHKKHSSFLWGKPIAGTTYFYWYDVESKAHIINGDGTDALTTHPADMKNISYKSISWHKRQLLDMMDAKIDFLMPVYWGVPGDYQNWSFVGIPPLVQAHDQLLREDKKPPKIGMFYDTSILRSNRFNSDGSNYHVDLTTPFGTKWFYTAIRDFFSMVPPSKWARINAKPIVFLYSASFAKAQDTTQLDFVREQFGKDFGIEPFIVKHRDWLGKSDAIYQWGGAINLQMDTHVAAIGPGYDHTAVPGRKPLIVERKGGQTYCRNWERLLATNPKRRPWLVHIETWNEWHEGTDIANSREYGKFYIELTGKYIDLFKQGAHLPVQGAYANAKEVSWNLKKENGITLRENIGDGLWEIRKVNNKDAVVTRSNESAHARYLYFLVDDSFIFDGDLTTEIIINYFDAGCDSFQVQYDNADVSNGPVQGAFRSSKTVKLSGTGQWKTATIKLPRCRFVNRANGADFRLAPLGGKLELAIHEIVLRKSTAVCFNR